jgi:DNA-binding CsgD family transcriptional regulator
VRVDLEKVRASVRVLEGAASFGEAETALDGLASIIGMPMMAWAPDVARPDFDAHMDQFLRRHGWPEEILALWWDQRVMLKMPLYIRCRFEHLPFVTPVDGPPGRTVAQRTIQAAMMQMGLHAMITVPTMLPRGRIAMLTWLGTQRTDEAESILRATLPELLAAAHFFMRAFDRARGQNVVIAERASHLTPREADCLRLVAQGYRDAEIARLSGLAATTVRSHLDNVVRKFGASNRVQAVAIAAQLGLLGALGD